MVNLRKPGGSPTRTTTSTTTITQAKVGAKVEAEASSHVKVEPEEISNKKLTLGSPAARRKGLGFKGNLASKTPDGNEICFNYSDPQSECSGDCERVHCCRYYGCYGKHPTFRHGKAGAGENVGSRKEQFDAGFVSSDDEVEHKRNASGQLFPWFKKSGRSDNRIEGETVQSLDDEVARGGRSRRRRH